MASADRAVAPPAAAAPADDGKAQLPPAQMALVDFKKWGNDVCGKIKSGMTYWTRVCDAWLNFAILTLRSRSDLKPSVSLAQFASLLCDYVSSALPEELGR